MKEMKQSSSGTQARTASISIALCAGALLSFSTIPAFAAPPEFAPVRVEVVSPLPLPVSGPAGGALSVVNVDHPARSPYQVTLCHGINATCGGVLSSTTAPSNRRLVIEEISGECTLTGNVSQLSLGLSTTAGGTVARHAIPFHVNPTLSAILEAARVARIYADAGTIMQLLGTFGTGTGGGAATCRITLSGHTVAL
jgi:hypothetical protein